MSRSLSGLFEDSVTREIGGSETQDGVTTFNYLLRRKDDRQQEANF